MAQQKRGLGKGLGALIPTTPIGLADPSPDGADGPEGSGGLEAESGPQILGAIPGAYFDEIAVAAISPNPRQPRQIFDEEALAEPLSQSRL